MCAVQWITFQTELFARKTLCNIMLDLCTLRRQTQTDIACFLFSPGNIGVSEMKQTANISCLLHVGIMLSLLEQAPEPPAEAQNTHFKPNEFFRTTQSLSFVIGEEKVLRSDTFFLSISPSSGKRDAVRLLLRRYPSLICICVSPHVEVAGSTGRVPFAYFSVLLTGLAPQAQTLKCLSSPKLRMNWFMGIWWI